MSSSSSSSSISSSSSSSSSSQSSSESLSSSSSSESSSSSSSSSFSSSSNSDAGSYIDIGLRAYSGSSTISLGCKTLENSPNGKLRIAKNGTIYSVELIDTTDPIASQIRIYDGAANKAVVKI